MIVTKIVPDEPLRANNNWNLYKVQPKWPNNLCNIILFELDT